jgi:hypothetical protein
MNNAELVTPSSVNPLVDTIAFGTQLSTLKTDFVTLWQSTSREFPAFGKEYSLEEKRRTEANVEDAISVENEADPDSEEASLQLQRMKSSVRGMVVQSIDPEHRGETDAMLREFSEAGDDFVRRARAFDPDLGLEDIFQALRNLWIINSMQAAFDLSVRVTPSGLAYSLLYPYSDNYLDDPSVTPSGKLEFSRRFRRRLLGLEYRNPSRLESKLSDLVEMIETEFPRSVYPDVYEGLLAIHAGQEKSIGQHGLPNYWAASDLLDISVEKGGSSVLADAYLAKGSLSIEEAEFAFGYGVFLQLIDDLQDVEEDSRNGHQTLFTLAASKGVLDAMANQLHRFIDDVVASFNPNVFQRPCTLSELVRRSCRVLILESIAQNPGSYSEAYSRDVERYSPMRFSVLRRLHEKMKSKQARLRIALKNKRVLAVAASTF